MTLTGATGTVILDGRNGRVHVGVLAMQMQRLAATAHAPHRDAPADLGAPSVRWRRWRLAELIVIGAAIVMRIPLVFRNITYRGDIWRQSDTASIARNFVADANLFFPRINWGGSGPGFVESELQLFPWTVSRLYRAFGEHVWLGRALALAVSAATLVCFWRLASRLLNRNAALIALAFLALSPEFIRYSTAFMPEAAALLFYTAALLKFDRWLVEHSWRMALECGACASLAGLIKPTTLHIGLIFAAVLVARRGWRSALSVQSLAIASIVVVPVALWMWHAARLHLDYGNTFGVISGGDRKFGGLSYWSSANFYTGTGHLELEWVYGFVGVVPALVGLVVAWQRRMALMIAGFAAILVYYFVAARYVEGELGIQYHVYSVVFGALAVGLGADCLLVRASRAHRGPSVRAATIAVTSLVALTFVAISARAYADQFKDYGADAVHCGEQMRAIIPAGDLVVISSGDRALDGGVSNNYQDPTLFYFGDHRGWSLAADQHDPARLDRYRRDGARWFVISDRARLDANTALATSLSSDPQVGPGFVSGATRGCAIYRLG